jgi:2-hydroxychromene-2-carboxylate isomerase
MHLRFYFDIVCPYAYLASLRVEAMAKRTGAHIEWCPVLLGGLYRHHGTDDVPAQGWPQNKVRLGILDLNREAQSNGAPFKANARHPQRSVTAMRLIVAASDVQRIPLSQALYRAYWVDDQDINDPEVLAPIAKAHGVNMEAAALQNIKDTLRTRTAEAASKGVFGVPTFEVNGKLWWGQDRMHLVEKALGGNPTIEPSTQPPTVETIVFFHDFSSPFSYLASTQMQRIADSHGVDLVYKPTLLGALFGAIGTANIPLFTFGEAKQAYIGRDLYDWADWWGVDFNFAPTFPLRTVTPLRVAIIEPKTTDCIYRAAWVDGLNIGDDAVLLSVLDQAGFNGSDLIAATQEQSIKNALRDNTEDAAQRGACGVPTIAVRNELFWGQDRLHRAISAISAPYAPTTKA